MNDILDAILARLVANQPAKAEDKPTPPAKHILPGEMTREWLDHYGVSSSTPVDYITEDHPSVVEQKKAFERMLKRQRDRMRGML